MRDIRDMQPNQVIDVARITLVAHRGVGNDWAVYWLNDGFYGSSSQEVLSEGEKLNEQAAKQIFPNIGGGPYRV